MSESRNSLFDVTPLVKCSLLGASLLSICQSEGCVDGGYATFESRDIDFKTPQGTSTLNISHKADKVAEETKMMIDLRACLAYLINPPLQGPFYLSITDH